MYQEKYLKNLRFQRKDNNLDKALAECSMIKNKADLSQGLLLKCIDNKRI